MNPAIFYILRWERELEAQDSRRHVVHESVEEQNISKIDASEKEEDHECACVRRRTVPCC